MTAMDPRLDEIQAIPAEAVEAAAKVHQDLQAKRGHPDWEELGELGTHAQNLRLEYMRAAIDAAHPVLLAELRKAHEAIERVSDWAGRNKTGYYDEAQDDVVQIIRAAVAAAKGDERG